jgi:4-amino-4-deoxy-L-arabinose transferase-like glycosyltransferase
MNASRRTGQMDSTLTGKPSALNTELLLFLLIILLAAFMRLSRLDLIDVRFDEASAPQLALSIARGNLLPVAPFSGSVANHPPLFLYALALPYLFTRDFMAVAAWRALLDVLAVALLWWLCRRFFSVRVALMACLLFAVAPWAIQFARKLGILSLPLFQCVLLFGLLEAIQRKNAWGWAIAGLGLALSVGAHLTSLYLVPVFLIALIVGRKTLRWQSALAGALPLLLLAGVYLGFDAQQGFANARNVLGGSGGNAQFSLDALNIALWTSGGAHLSDLTSSAFPIWQAQVPASFNLIDTLQMALLVLGAGLLLAQCFSRRRFYPLGTLVVLLAWLLLPVLLQMRSSRPLQMHYFIPLQPVTFVVMALAVDASIRWMNTRRMQVAMRIAGATVIALIAGWQVFTTLRFTQFVQQYDTTAGGFGPPIRSGLDVAALARNAIENNAASDVIVVTPGGDPNVNELATVMDVLLADVSHRFADANAGIILREDGAQYIFAPGTQRALNALLQNVDAAQVVTRTVKLREGSDLVYTHVLAPRLSLAPVQEAPAQWANGVGLLGYRLPAGHGFTVETLSRVFREAQAGENSHWFNHVYQGDQKIAQQDGGGIHPRNWRVGDILMQWFDLTLPANAQPDRVRVGIYTYPDMAPVMVVDPARNPTADGVDLAVPR